MNNVLFTKNNVHFIGVGGISMSGLAEILLSKGIHVSGSDITYSPIIKHLESLGLTFYQGHSPKNVCGADCVVYTSAIKPDNPEFAEAVRLGIDTLPRAALLGNIMKSYKNSMAIAGTHGKTTVTSMVSYIFEKLSLDPTILVGAQLDIINNNMKLGKSDYFIAEACEYCRSFLNFFPHSATILNVEPDHLDYFKDADDYHLAYAEFLKNVEKDGFVIACFDDPDLMKLVSDIPQKVVTYGLTGGTLSARDITLSPEGTEYLLVREDHVLCKVKLSLHGNHNILNSMAALSNAYMFGLDMQKAADALSDFKGASRRFEFKGMSGGAYIYDDYAHHPTEIKATFETAKSIAKGKIICVFQPHTYSRTKLFFEDFVKVLGEVDVVILADIYAAREKDDGSISSALLAAKIDGSIYIGSFEKIAAHIKSILEKDDIVIVMGAGDIVGLTDLILQ